MSKQILFNKEAREKIYSGINMVADSVKCTLGPAGGNAILENQFGLMISNDGWTVAKDIELEDKFENLGVKLIRQVAEKTDSNAKGGRTTAVTIAQELIKEGRKHIESGMNPVKIRIGMEMALKDAVSQIKKSAKKISTDAEVAQVATISSESKETGELVAKVLKKAGPNGFVTVEGSNTSDTRYELSQGFQFDKGYISPYFVNNDRQEAVLKDCLVLISDKRLSNGKETVELIEKVLQAGEKNLLVIADDVADQSLATFVVNKMQGVANIVCVKPPEWGDWRKKVMEDIAVLTDTVVLSEQNAKSLGNIEVEHLGRIGKVIVSKDKTTLIGGSGDVEGRIEVLKYELSEEKDVVERERLEQRIGKLSSGVATILVGAPTEAEIIYKRQKTEDGVNDAKSALEEGVVSGGGVCLAKLKLKGKSQDSDIQAGYDVVKKSLGIQLKQIVENAGISGDVVHSKVLEMAGNGGYDAKNNIFVDDMIDMGIVDSARVTRLVLENAVSIASIALTVRVAIAEEKKEEVNSQGKKI